MTNNWPRYSPSPLGLTPPPHPHPLRKFACPHNGIFIENIFWSYDVNICIIITPWLQSTLAALCGEYLHRLKILSITGRPSNSVRISWLWPYIRYLSFPLYTLSWCERFSRDGLYVKFNVYTVYFIFPIPTILDSWQIICTHHLLHLFMFYKWRLACALPVLIYVSWNSQNREWGLDGIGGGGVS